MHRISLTLQQQNFTVIGLAILTISSIFIAIALTYTTPHFIVTDISISITFACLIIAYIYKNYNKKRLNRLTPLDIRLSLKMMEYLQIEEIFALQSTCKHFRKKSYYKAAAISLGFDPKSSEEACYKYVIKFFRKIVPNVSKGIINYVPGPGYPYLDENEYTPYRRYNNCTKEIIFLRNQSSPALIALFKYYNFRTDRRHFTTLEPIARYLLKSKIYYKKLSDHNDKMVAFFIMQDAINGSLISGDKDEDGDFTRFFDNVIHFGDEPIFINIIKLMIKLGAPVDGFHFQLKANRRKPYTIPPLLLAAQKGQLTYYRLLLEQGAKPISKAEKLISKHSNESIMDR